jgi:hypothetical protein
MRTHLSPAASTCFALRYESLHRSGHCLVFPCDANGAIDLDALPDRARINYFAARAMVGREFAHPVVEPVLEAA